MKTEARGRKPLPADKRKPPQATVKINDFILPFVNELKGNLKNKTLTPDVLQRLFDVLRGQAINNNPDTADIQRKLVTRYDAEHQKVLNLESSNSRLKSQLKEIKIQLKQLQHKEYTCQALTKSGERCTRPAKLVTDWYGVSIHTCLQHSKKQVT
jgi:hypothetical protein